MQGSWKEYDSRPVTRVAYEIRADDEVNATGEESTYVIEIDGESVKFKAYEDPEPGDYVVRLTEEDTYHCRRDVFHERNVVEG